MCCCCAQQMLGQIFGLFGYAMLLAVSNLSGDQTQMSSWAPIWNIMIGCVTISAAAAFSVRLVASNAFRARREPGAQVLSVFVQLPPDCADVPSDKPSAEAPPGHASNGGATKDSGGEEGERHSLVQAAGGGRKGGEQGESDEYEEGRQAALAARAGARASKSPPAG